MLICHKLLIPVLCFLIFVTMNTAAIASMYMYLHEYVVLSQWNRFLCIILQSQNTYEFLILIHILFDHDCFFFFPKAIPFPSVLPTNLFSTSLLNTFPVLLSTVKRLKLLFQVKSYTVFLIIYENKTYSKMKKSTLF